ncbi:MULTISPECIES: CRISPR-associated ring nuclease Csm6 [Acinetobacter]|uniref:CRISPR-associated ring nuclease Csm6 n=1 Tax=Acinetobacter TaxID=469 RepID=UPI001D659F2A|nr:MULTISPECIES: CRISPR-associated ring nuclease Csm6 [Acinetobacter]MCS4297567.1 CRISPR-associated protein (TIGR02584 family) [Acinetobacter guillouiae]MCW2249753.1 CRISPR-associated protein (TIGR02584 family) [Acinetobacter sp. BIGb0204]NII38857.1 CRISPR-associated protein (TIGR02584 family) [Acinetobacter sp. BIGb0196]
MKKNILFLVTGMTPQIITETVWALACDPQSDEKWIPDEIHIMSTDDGLNQIRKRLFEDQVFQQFQIDFPQLKNIEFNLIEHLHVIRDVDGNVLVDLKTPEHNQCAGNAICEKIREFTQNEDVSLHVSIAGGRKTMGFYAGYALSLYGRAQDTMSHVLVEERFEVVKDFFYPTPKTYFVTNRDGKVLDAKEAVVWLAHVEFVRMRDAIKDKHQLKSTDSFSQVVHKINESFNDVKLKINLHNQTIEVNDKFTIDDLPPREFSLLHWFADRRKRGLEGIIAPNKNITSNDAKPSDLEIINQLTKEFTPYYEEVKNISEENKLTVDKKFFESVKSHLKASLEARLGLELAAKLGITQERDHRGTLKKGTPFYLNLPSEAIEIVDTF